MTTLFSTNSVDLRQPLLIQPRLVPAPFIFGENVNCRADSTAWMGQILCKAMTDVASEDHRGLMWSLRPIFNSMRIFGIELDVVQRRLVLRRAAAIFQGAAMVIFVVLSSLVKTLWWTKFDHSSTLSWLNAVIDYTNFSRTLLFPMVMGEMMLLCKWTPLREKLEQMDKLLSYPTRFHNRLRRVCIASMASVCLLVNSFHEPDLAIEWIRTICVCVSLSLSQELATKLLCEWFSLITASLKPNPVQSVTYISNLVVDFYEDLTIALFFCLTWLASKSIEIIIDDVQTYSPALQQASSLRVLKWQRSYCLIMNFIQGVGQFFEVALFLFLLKQFLFLFFFFVHVVFYTFFLGNNRFISFYLMNILKNFLLMSAIIFGSHLMKKKTGILVEELSTRRCFMSVAQAEVKVFLQNHQPHLHWFRLWLQVDHINEFMNDIQQRYPRIAPMGMFEISPTLLLSVKQSKFPSINFWLSVF